MSQIDIIGRKLDEHNKTLRWQQIRQQPLLQTNTTAKRQVKLMLWAITSLFKPHNIKHQSNHFRNQLVAKSSRLIMALWPHTIQEVFRWVLVALRRRTSMRTRWRWKGWIVEGKWDLIRWLWHKITTRVNKIIYMLDLLWPMNWSFDLEPFCRSIRAIPCQKIRNRACSRFTKRGVVPPQHPMIITPISHGHPSSENLAPALPERRSAMTLLHIQKKCHHPANTIRTSSNGVNTTNMKDTKR